MKKSYLWRNFCRYFHTTLSNNPLALEALASITEITTTCPALDLFHCPALVLFRIRKTIRTIYGAVNEMEGIIWTQKPSYKMGWSLDATDRVKCWTGSRALMSNVWMSKMRAKVSADNATTNFSFLLQQRYVTAKAKTDFCVIFLWGIFKYIQTFRNDT